MALKRVWIPSPSYSSRGGAGVRLIVLHTAEGARTIQSLGSWFANSANQVSSHTGADDTPNTVGEYVHRDNKAWTASNANPVAVQIELCGFASWTAAEWDQHPNMLQNTAAWIAEEAAHYGIPITRLNSEQAQGGGHGVCQHADLGSWGGGHWDCGSSFPIDRVLDMARGGGTPAPSPAPDKPEVTEMIASAVANNGTIHTFVVGKNRHTVFYTFQPKDGGWNGGKAGKQVAGLQKFADARDGGSIRGIAAERGAGGALQVFITYDNGDVAYTWQPSGSTAWQGGQPGKQIAAFSPFAPAP
jgi:hypothetical protein